MSFSMTGFREDQGDVLPDHTHSSLRKQEKIVTLQARTHNGRLFQYPGRRYGKKTFPSVSAALTLEAVMGLTLFIFAAVCLLLPMKIMSTERKVQAALESLGEDFSRYAYVKEALEKGKIFAVAGVGDFAREFGGHLASGIAVGYGQERVMAHVDTEAMRHVNLLRSQVLEDGETVDLILDYEIRLPFPVLGLPALKRTARCSRRAWLGLDGKDYGEDGAAGEEKDEIVYIGKGSTRYHRSRSCHYLANNLTAVPLGQVGEKRNQSGGKYYPCAVCGKTGGSTVYIMPSGGSYHFSRNCTAIVAYVRAVRLSEVEHLGACSYCGGK